MGPCAAEGTMGRRAAGLDGARAYIDAGAIAHNLARLRGLLRIDPAGSSATPGAPSAARIWAVVKADAYGHTLAMALPGLAQADGLAVLALGDAYNCRALGWRKPILVMGANFRRADLLDPVLHPLHLIIDRDEQVRELEALHSPHPPQIWLRSRGHLHHAGFAPERYRRAYHRLQPLRRAGRLAGLGHLLHYADAEDPRLLMEEKAAFAQLTGDLPGPLCTQNSAALLVGGEHGAGAAWARCGIALYGVSPLAQMDGAALGLKPAMRLAAPLYGEQHIEAGSRLGYGGLFQAQRNMRIGLLRCGYADGYPRTIGEDCSVLIDGRLCPIVGRVSMDAISVDLSHHPDAGPGAMATLWGAEGLPIEHVARSAGTIPAQLCTALTARVPRLPAAG